MSQLTLPDEVIRQATAAAARKDIPLEDWVALAVRTMVALQIEIPEGGRLNPMVKALTNIKPPLREVLAPDSPEWLADQIGGELPKQEPEGLELARQGVILVQSILIAGKIKAGTAERLHALRDRVEQLGKRLEGE